MVIRKIEIDDTLDELVEGVKEEVKEAVINLLNEYIDDDISQFSDIEDDVYDNLHEIVDSSTPIYYSEIDGLYYLYSNILEEAYNNMGIGNGGEDNHQQVTIYCYLEQEAHDYLRELSKEIDDVIQDGVKEAIKAVEAY